MRECPWRFLVGILAHDIVRAARAGECSQGEFEALVGEFRRSVEDAIRAARVEFMDSKPGAGE